MRSIMIAASLATPPIIAFVGGIWIIAGAIAFAYGATPGPVLIAFGAGHLLAARGMKSGAIWAFGLGAALGAVAIAALTVVAVFYVGMTTAEGGFKLEYLAFPPLDPVASVVLFGLLVAAGLLMLITGARGLRGGGQVRV